MLFIYDDQAKLGKREEQRRTRADDDARPAGGDGAPGVAAFALPDLRMPLRRQDTKAVAKPLQPLRAKRYLREQHQYLPSGCERRRDRREIGFGLARAGDAVEQGHAKPAGFDTADKPLRCDRLVGGQPRTGRMPIGRRRFGPLGRDQAVLDQPNLHQVADDAGAAAGEARGFDQRQRQPVAQGFEHPAACRGQRRFRRVSGECCMPSGRDRATPSRPRRLQRLGNAHRHAQHRARRGHCIGGDALDESAECRFQRW